MCGWIEDGEFHAVDFHEMDCYVSGMWPDGRPFPYGLDEFVKRHRDLSYAMSKRNDPTCH